MNEQLRNTLIIVDTQRGFMPASEGERLQVEGFGELPVSGGEKIIEQINRLVTAFAHSAENLILTTQDWHPAETGHFAQPDEPNWINTWPVHCVGGTPGAELHPDLLVAQQPELAKRFIKGDVACISPEDDTSYTGALAYDPETNVLLPDWLREMKAERVYLTGVALGDGAENSLCVDSTAKDLNEQGFDVVLVTDASEAVMPENRERCFQNLGSIGVTLMTTKQVLAELNTGA